MRCLAALLLVLAVPGAAFAQKPKAALMPLAAKHIPKETVEILDLLLAAEVERAGRFQVIGVTDVNAMLGLERMKEALGCSDVACAAELGGALGVDLLLTGTAGKLGDELVLQLTIIDIRASKVERRGNATAPAEERHYKGAVQRLVADALGLASPAPQGPRLSGAPLSPARLRFDTAEPAHAFDVELVASDGVQQRCPAAVTLEQACLLEQVAVGEGQVRATSGVLGPLAAGFEVDDEKETVVFSLRESPSQGSIIAWSLGGMALAAGVALMATGIALDESGLVYGGIPTAVLGAGSVGLGFTFDGRVLMSTRHLREEGSSWWPF